MNDEQFLNRFIDALDARSKKPNGHPVACAIHFYLSGDGHISKFHSNKDAFERDIKAGEALCELAHSYFPQIYNRVFEQMKREEDGTQKTVSIGYDRADGDFRILATLSNIDNEMDDGDFNRLIKTTRSELQRIQSEKIKIVERQDAPDYVDLDE